MFLMEEGKVSCHQCGCVMYAWESWREDFVEREQLFAVGESCRHFKRGNLDATWLVTGRKDYAILLSFGALGVDKDG